MLKVKARSHCAIFSDCDCDYSYRNKWVVQDSMVVFTLWNCDNVTNSYPPITSKNKSQSQSEKNVLCEWAFTRLSEHEIDIL